MDLTNLNWICLEHCFSLPRMNQLVDSTIRNDLLTFINAFLGYNWIQISLESQKKTTFVTNQELYFYQMIPFSLKNAWVTYQYIIDTRFKAQVVSLWRCILELNKSQSCPLPRRNIWDFQTAKDKAKSQYIFIWGNYKKVLWLHRPLLRNRCQASQCVHNFRVEISNKQERWKIQSLLSRQAVLSRFISRLTNQWILIFKTFRGTYKFAWNDKYKQTFRELKGYIIHTPIMTKQLEGGELKIYLVVSKKV